MFLIMVCYVICYGVTLTKTQRRGEKTKEAYPTHLDLTMWKCSAKNMILT